MSLPLRDKSTCHYDHIRLGEVTKDPTLTIEAVGKTFAWPLEKLRTPFEKTIPSLMSWEK
jgi:hypothetical protein